MGTKEVMVKVTNVDEDGTVTLSALGHQAGTKLTATLTDPDGTISNQMWQWSRSATMGGALTDITDETSASYTPTSGDTGAYLVAKVTYEDAEGDGKTAMSEPPANAVQAVRTPNMAPVFPDDDAGSDQTTRSVAENTPAGRTVGDPVKADPKDGDVLTYTLRDVGGGTVVNSASFDINRATGQIMTKGALNTEGGPTYTVVVRATDPAGEPPLPMMDAAPAVAANSDEITVIITVTDVNEGPAFSGGGEMLTADEDANITNDNVYVASDPDSDDSGETVTWSLLGADRSKFDISNADSDAGELTFKTGSLPNYEMPGDADMDNVYEVTVVATTGGTGRSMAGTRDVKVTVENVEEEGTGNPEQGGAGGRHRGDGQPK